MNKKEILTTLGASLLVVSAFALPQVFAENKNGGNENFGSRPIFDETKIDAIEKAIADKDYSAWKALVEGQKITETINEQNFSKYADALLKIKEGQETLKELGVDGRGFGGFNRPMPSENGKNIEDRAAIEKALENNDYSSWKSLVEGQKITETINEQNFSRFAEAHKLLSEGKQDEAKVIFEELGLKNGVGMGFGGGRFFHQENKTDK
ncbi:MAG: hypothetical protein PHZ25_02525 [Candidatus Pacebacteria bacterium]|nr:hypothetical protein [Candidatus Paceibacterota bacterium]